MTAKALSARAAALFERIKGGDYYPVYDAKTPKAMQELIDAGLVSKSGRVESIRLCWVPSTGYTPFISESFQ